MDHGIRAAELFLEGRSCSQAVVLAFSDLTGLDNHFAAKMAASFGGGMGRMREVCGAVSGALMALGALKGYDDVSDIEIKKAHYVKVQAIMKGFEQELSSYICRDIIKVLGAQEPSPTPRTEEFYKARPCEKCVRCAARLLDTLYLGLTDED